MIEAFELKCQHGEHKFQRNNSSEFEALFK